MGAGGRFADQALPHHGRHEGHPQGTPGAQVSVPHRLEAHQAALWSMDTASGFSTAFPFNHGVGHGISGSTTLRSILRRSSDLGSRRGELPRDARLQFRMELQGVHRIRNAGGGGGYDVCQGCTRRIHALIFSEGVSKCSSPGKGLFFERFFDVLTVLPNRRHVSVTITPPVPMQHQPEQHVLGLFLAVKLLHRSTHYRISVAMHFFSRVQGCRFTHTPN